ncbi:hypothetical protein HZA97_01775 [Candidatus Woesearchaeota archaeon]|nr:hypothetical protein [Candidatus Woesearchaeota archaeon]
MERTIVVDDLTYFRALDYSVREAMKAFETSLVEAAEQTVSDIEAKVGSYPVEGYYHETENLTRYFNAIRTLQDPVNFSEKVTDNIKLFNKIYTHPVFGLKQAMPTALNKDAYWKDHEPVVVSPVIDPVTIATQKTYPSWTFDTIMTAIEGQELGTCLVGLAALVDQNNKVDGKYNPVATTWARETTVLSAAKFVARSCMPSKPTIDWQVSKEVEEYGTKVLAGYADLIENNSLTRNVRRPYEVNEKTISALLSNSENPRRCVHLCTDDKKNHYHWAVAVDNNGKYRVVDFYAKKIVTTKEYQKDPSAVLQLEFFDRN